MFLEKFINMLCHYLFLSARAPKKYNILIQEPNFALPEEDMKEFDQRSYWCHHKSSSCDQPYTLKLRTNARSSVMKKDGMAVVCGGSLPQLERKKFNKTWMMSHSRFMILDASPFLYRSWLMKKLLTRGCHLCKVQKGHEVFRHISSYYQKGSYKMVP